MPFIQTSTKIIVKVICVSRDPTGSLDGYSLDVCLLSLTIGLLGRIFGYFVRFDCRKASIS